MTFGQSNVRVPFVCLPVGGIFMYLTFASLSYLFFFVWRGDLFYPEQASPLQASTSSEHT